MEHLIKDVRHGVRALWQNRALSALAILALAIGIGTVACQFSIVRGVLYRGLPFPDGHRLFHVEWAGEREQGRDSGIRLQDLVEFQRQQTSFEGLVGYYSGTVNFRVDGAPVRLNGVYMSAAFLEQIRVRPNHGRGFQTGDDQPGAAPVALISHGLWQREFGGQGDVVGRTAHVNGRPCTIVGIMDPSFGFPGNEAIWLPLSHTEADKPRGSALQTPPLAVFGRLRAGTSPETAAAELETVAARLAQEHPATNKDLKAVTVRPLIHAFTDGGVRDILWLMLVAAFLVLGVACANVANLLLAQATRRTKELAIRSAVGASRGRLVVQMLTEGLVVSIVGAVLGIALAGVGLHLIWADVQKLDPPSWMRFEIDGAVLVFVVATTLLASLLSGLVPALQASRADVNTILKDDSRTSSGLHLGRFARLLVVVQIAFSCGLLAAALLMAKLSYGMRTIDFPFQPSEIFSARMALFETDYPDDAVRARFIQQVERVLAADPEIGEVAFSGTYRFFNTGRQQIRIDGRDDVPERELPRVRREVVRGGYFPLLRAAPLDGRDFGPADFEPGAPRVAIVNAPFARRFFSERSPLGARFAEAANGQPPEWITIVGVVPDLHMQGVDSDLDDGSGYYLPIGPSTPRFVTVLTRPRAGGDPTALAAVVRRNLQTVDPNLPLYDTVTLEQNLEELLRGYDIFATIFAGLGVSALFLASIGVYGVMSFAVNQRRHEIGIRMALGASGKGILAMIFLQGGRQVGLGVLLGLGLAFGFGTILAATFETMRSIDVPVFALVASVLLLVAVVAMLGPARRAAGVSPMQALRVD